MDKIAIASDHGGYDLKMDVAALLRELGYKVEDMGPQNSNSVDYPDYGISLGGGAGLHAFYKIARESRIATCWSIARRLNQS